LGSGGSSVTDESIQWLVVQVIVDAVLSSDGVKDALPVDGIDDSALRQELLLGQEAEALLVHARVEHRVSVGAKRRVQRLQEIVQARFVTAAVIRLE
jgi:hypothetical protein